MVKSKNIKKYFQVPQDRRPEGKEKLKHAVTYEQTDNAPIFEEVWDSWLSMLDDEKKNIDPTRRLVLAHSKYDHGIT